MDIGKNLFDWVQEQVGYLILAVTIIGALGIAYKRQFSMLIGFIIGMGILAAIVFDPKGVVAEPVLKLWKTVIG